MRTRQWTLLVLLGALTLGACSDTDSGGLEPEADVATYKIAFQGPVSGDFAQVGINEINGVQLAVDEANASGELPFRLELLTADDGGDPAKAPAAAAQAIQDPLVMGVVGPSFSGAALAVGEDYAAAGLSIVSPSASQAQIQLQGFATWHRVIPNDEAEGPAAADWLALSAESVMVISDKTSYGDGVANAVAAQLEASGVTVTREAADAETTRNYGPLAQTVVQADVDAVFYAGYDAIAAQFARALDAAGYAGIRMSGNGAKSNFFTDGAQESGEGWYFSCGCADPTADPAAAAFAAAYEEKFGTPPSTYSAEAYDAARILIAAMVDAYDGGLSRDAVEAAVDATDFQGITGRLTFGPDGDVPPGFGTVNLYQVQDGVIVSLGDITAAAGG